MVTYNAFPREPETNNRSATVGITPVNIAEQQINGKRTFISVVNTSTSGQIVYLSVGEEAVLGQGFPMSPGGSFSEDTSSIVFPSQKHYSVIADAAGATVAIQERTITGEF